MEFKWSVNKVTIAENNLITKVDLTVTATDGNNISSAAYTRDLVRGSFFTLYAQLTEQQVLDWCFEPEVIVLKNSTVITKLLKEDGEAQVAGQIQRRLDQKIIEPDLPWVIAAQNQEIQA
jgi:hypothetical protein